MQPHEKFALPWWAEKSWWRDERVGGQPLESADAIDEACRVAAGVFDRESWISVWDKLRNSPGSGSRIVGALVGTGLMPLAVASSLGDAVRLTRSARGFERILAELRSGLKTDTAFLTLEVARALIEAGLETWFPREESVKTPDVQCVALEKTISVECKMLAEEQWEHWMGSLMHEVIMSLYAPCKVTVEFHRRISEVNFGDADELNQAVIAELVKLVRDAIEPEITRPVETERVINVPGVATIRLRPESHPECSGVGGAEISEVSQVRRLFNNGVFRAAKQIPLETTGVVVVHVEHLPDPTLVKTVFAAARKVRHSATERVEGVVILPRQYLGGRRAGMLVLCDEVSAPVIRVSTALSNYFGLERVS